MDARRQTHGTVLSWHLQLSSPPSQRDAWHQSGQSLHSGGKKDPAFKQTAFLCPKLLFSELSGREMERRPVSPSEEAAELMGSACACVLDNMRNCGQRKSVPQNAASTPASVEVWLQLSSPLQDPL